MTEMIDLLAKIKQYLQQGAYENESHVSGSIVRPILRALDWDVENPLQVQPEYRLQDGTRLDYGLCIDGKLRVIIEVKAVDKLKEADLQLFQYAFHAGTPLAILTDGREWHVYYAYGTGDYPDRLVRILDIFDQPLDELADYLSCYLAFEEVKSKRAENNAKKDLQDKVKREAAKKAIPKAWKRLVSYETNEQLVNLLTEETAQDTGSIAPNKDDVIAFLQNLAPPSKIQSSLQTPKRTTSSSAFLDSTRTPQSFIKPQKNTESPPKQRRSRTASYELFGMKKTYPNAALAYGEIINNLTQKYPYFLESLAKELGELYLSQKSFEDLDKDKRAKKIGEWYLNTRLANPAKIKYLKIACKVAGIKFGSDLKVSFPTSTKPRGTTSRRSQKSSKKLSSYTFSALLGGATNESPKATEIYGEIMNILARRYPTLLTPLANQLGKKQLSRYEADIPHHIRLSGGWFLNKRITNPAKKKFIRVACKLAGVKIGKDKDLKFYFPNTTKTRRG